MALISCPNNVRALLFPTLLLSALAGLPSVHAQPTTPVTTSGQPPASAQWEAMNRELSRRVNGADGLLDEQSLEMARQLIQIAEQTYGPVSARAANSHYFLGFIHRRRAEKNPQTANAEYSQAAVAFTRAVEIQEKLPVGNLSNSMMPSLAFYLSNLGDAYKAQGAWAKASTQYERMIGVIERTMGPDVSVLANCFDDLAITSYKQGDYGKSATASLRALDLAERHGYKKETIDRYTHNLGVLGRDALSRGDAVNAIPLLERQVAQLQKSGRASPDDLAKARQSLDTAQRKAGTAAHQLAGKSGSGSGGGAGSQLAQPTAKNSGKPVWPSDMEPGNIYFVVEIDQEDYPPIMVSALSGQEAVARVQAARAKDRLLRPTTFKLLAGRECIGPAWGAVVTLGWKPWGAACANTPAAAIEGAFTGCRQHDPKGRGCEPEPSIVLALSGSTSWSSDTSAQGLHGRFGSYNAQTWMEQYTKSPVNSMQQALSGFDKACSDGRPCYKTSSNTGCIHETPHSETLGKCMDRKLTPGGLSGSIRSRLR